jgi:RsiW-degrading membrane proteinase PrsW (M82 family)
VDAVQGDSHPHDLDWRVWKKLANILLVGVVEEGLKAAPLILTFLNRGIPTTPRAAAFLGGVSGLAIGVAEAVQYSFMY